jgi:FkbM family methyltransferase
VSGADAKSATPRERARWFWQFGVRRRLVRVGWLRRLPWRLWLFLCAWDAESVVAELGRRRGELTFVQIGSNDGVANDPLHATVRERRWSGVCVEPLPHLFDRLTSNYRGVEGVSCVRAAIAAERGTITMFTVDPAPGDPHWVDQLASLDAEVIRGHAYALPDLEGRIRPVEVPTLSLAELVAEHRLEAIDLMHVDAEGYDAEIIDQIPASAGWAPAVLIFERKHLPPARLAASEARLRSAGYHLVDLWPDELAWRR